MGIPDFRKMREEVERIRSEKDAAFPAGCMVSVNSARFHGIGFVVKDDTCPLEQLPVRVESQNVWWYPIEDCQPYHGKMPSWIRSLFRQHKIKRIDPPFRGNNNNGDT